MIRVKICGLTRPEDVRAAVTAGADALGFVLAPSPRCISVAQARRLLAGVPPFVTTVGVVVDQPLPLLQYSLEELGLDRLQFHGQETNAWMRRFPRPRVIRALRPAADAPLPVRDPAPAAGAYLVDALVPGQVGGTGKKSNWPFARHLRRFGKPVILAGGLTPENVSEAIRRVRPDMVDVSSGVELRPGVKDPARIRAFIRAVRRADGSSRRLACL
ncbi:MAG: phosphoribosylanthranilate isomerase [candidate division FCPU426 bacterium]